MQPPDMGNYLWRHHAYQQFAALVILLAALFAWRLVKARGDGVVIAVPLWWLIALAFAIRLPLLFQSYWYDEAFTSLVVRSSWRDFFAIVATDVHPPGYYGLIKLTTIVLGDSAFTMRLPALFAGVALVPVMYAITEHHHGKTAALWAATITTFLPAVVYYSSEARYPAALALTLAFTYLSVQRERWWLAGISLALAAAFHVNAWFYVGVFVLWMWWHYVGVFDFWIWSYRRWLPSFPALIVCASWLPFALVQSRDVLDGFWLQQSIIVRFIVDMTITARFSEWNMAFVLFVVVYFVTVLAASVWQWRKQASLLWLLLVVVPPVAQWLVGVVLAPIYLPRTLMFSALLMVLPMSWYLANEAKRIVPVLLVFSMLAGVVSIYSQDRSITDEIVAECGELPIYAGTTYSAIVASHHSDNVLLWRGGETTAQSMNEDVRERMWLLTDFTWLPPSNACVFVAVDNFISQEQLDHLLAALDQPTIVQNNQYIYYIMEIR